MGSSNLNVLHLFHWKNWILDLKNYFPSISFSHIYREFNTIADAFSKEVVGPSEDFLHYEEILDGEILDSGKLFLFSD